MIAVEGRLQSRVALRKESVDRNRARGFEAYSCDVALRKESVDRNPAVWAALSVAGARRSPQGERG